MRIVLLLAAALAISSCKPADEPKPTATDSGEQAMNYASEIAKMPKPARDAALFRAIRDAGLPCQKIIDSAPMDEANAQSATWRAQCEDKAYHLITIKPDGQAVVVSRTTP